MARPRHFETWIEKGLLKSKLQVIRDLASQNIPQAKIAKAIGLSEKTFITMKQEHVEIQEAMEHGNSIMIEELMNKMYELAVGKCEKTKTTTTAETADGKTKKKVVKDVEVIPPNPVALKYLLAVKGGKAYKENKAELELMEKRLENGEEIWNDENSDEAVRRIKYIRKQSKKE